MFYRKGNEEIYTPPHLLIKENIGKEKLSIFYSDKYLVFRDKIIGIHCPATEKNKLEHLSDFLRNNSNILRFYIVCTSAQLSVSRATAIIKQDIMGLPYPENFVDLNISEAECLLTKDVLKYFISNSDDLEFLSDKVNLFEFGEIFCKTLNGIYQNNKSFQLFKIIDAGKYYALHFEYTSEELHPIIENADDIEEYIEAVIPSRKEIGRAHV